MRIAAAALCLYVQDATMRRWVDTSGVDPYGGEASGSTKSAHSYSV